MGRLLPILLTMVALVLTACGGSYSRTEVARKDEGSVEYIPEDKATRIEPFVRADIRSGAGTVALTFTREIEGPVWRAPRYIEQTTTTYGTDPHLPELILLDTLTLGIPLFMAVFDKGVRDKQLKLLTGERGNSWTNQRTVVDTANAQPAGRVEMRGGPWPNAPFVIRLGQARFEGTSDNGGTASVRITEVLGLVDDPLVALNETLVVEAAMGQHVKRQFIELDSDARTALVKEVIASIYDQGAKANSTKRHREAVEFFRKAADLGHPRGQLHLGLALWEGQGVPKNDVEARLWLERAAQQGVPEAQLALARSYAPNEWSIPLSGARQVYLWSNLAAANLSEGRDKAIRLRDRAAIVLSPKDLVEVQGQASRWTPTIEAVRLPTELLKHEARESRSVAAQIEPPPLPAPDPGKVKGRANPNAVALIIGIDRYESLPQADFAEADAKVFQAFAVNAMGLKPERVKALVGRDARRLDIEKVLHTWLKAEVDAGKTEVIVYFSGHGLASEDGLDLYLMPHDGDRILLDHSAVSRRRLVDTIRALKPKGLTLLLDTCYSGGTRSNHTLLASVRPVMLVARDDAPPEGVSMLTAAANDQLSSAFPAARHGLFSYFLMKGLEGGADRNADHSITLAEMHGFLTERVPKEAARLGRSQMPQLVGEGGRVIAAW
jgi:uncharacterized caspase-like protein